MSGPYLIGVTGPIGAGKSEVCRLLAESLGLPVLDADRIGHDALHSGQPVTREILRHFGPGVAAADGGIDRARLGALVFSDPEALARLNRLVHPWILEQIAARVSALKASGYVGMILLDAALLPDWIDRCAPDAVVLVRASRVTRQDRLRAKGIDAAEAERRMAAQDRLFGPMPAADWWILDNDGTPEALQTAVAELGRRLQTRFPEAGETEHS